MKRLLPFILLCALGLSAAAQMAPITKQVLIVSGGKFGDPNNYVRVGSYDPKTKTYTVFDSIHAASTKTAIVPFEGAQQPFGYVTADTVILKYNLITHQRVAISPSAKGISYLGYTGDYILASRGFGADSDYVMVYNASDLSFAHTIKGISGQAAGIVAFNDSAYVAVPGAFGNLTGKIAVIDLENMVLAREIDLDTLGQGIDKLFGLEYSGEPLIYAVSAKHNMLIVLDPMTGNVTTKALGKDVDRSFMRSTNSLLVEVPGSVAEYDLENDSFVSDTTLLFSEVPGVVNSWDIAAIAYDQFDWGNHNRIYASVTDFFSYGRVFVYNDSGKLVDTIETGISPEAIAFYREITGGFDDPDLAGLKLNLYPNPASLNITCKLPQISSGSYQVLSLTGQVMRKGEFSKAQSVKVNLESLNSGMYFLQVNTDKGVGTARFLRQ